jgi:iron-sulfur cluster assembly protein
MITLSERAAAEIKGLLEKQETPNALLRVFVAGGGCSGLQYGMSLEEEAMEGDEHLESSGVKVVVDPRSFPYLEGAEIDYVDSMMGGGFKIDNPNAKSSCGCGHSFTPKDEEEPEMAGGGGGGCGGCSNSGF